MAYQDRRQEALIACAMLGNNAAYLQSALERIRRWIQANWSAGEILSETIELI